MAELKPGWRRVRFGEVVRLNRETCRDPEAERIERYIGLEHLEPEDLRVRSWGEVAEGTTFTNRVRPGQVLFGKRRAYQRKVAVADFDAVCSGDIYVFETADPAKLLPELLPFLCQTEAFFAHAVGTSAGSLSPRTNWSSLKEYEFALPPLEEQGRIADSLQAHQAAVEEHHALAVAADQVRRALGKKRFIESPEGESTTVGEIAEVRNGTTPKRKTERYWNGSIPWLPTGKVNERRILTADEHITRDALGECSLGGIMPVGTCLVAMIGEGITRGKVARLEIEACINQNFAAIVPGGSVDSWYLFHYLEAHYESLRRWSQGTNQQALNCSLVRAFPLHLPDLARQATIAAELNEVDHTCTAVKRRLNHARATLETAAHIALDGHAQ